MYTLFIQQYFKCNHDHFVCKEHLFEKLDECMSWVEDRKTYCKLIFESSGKHSANNVTADIKLTIVDPSGKILVPVSFGGDWKEYDDYRYEKELLSGIKND
jgi:hypothetical protein